MLRIYLSYAPADKSYLNELLEWLRPLEEKYALRVYHPQMTPMPNLHHHKYYVPGQELVYPSDWETAAEQLEAAHLYLFLISYHALCIPYIDQEEVSAAVTRYQRLGKEFVRVFPVLLSPSRWKEQSRLAGFDVLGGDKTLVETDPRENGYKRIIEQLILAIEALRRNWAEEQHRLGLPTDESTRSELSAPTRNAYQTIPGWAGAVMVMALLYMTTSWYFSACAPRMYYLYTPESLPYEPAPEQYWRHNPLYPPEDVPLRVDRDTAGYRLHLPE